MDAAATADDIMTIEPPPVVPPAAPKTPKEPRVVTGSPLQQLAREEEADLKSWIDSLAGEAPIKVTIRRKRPVAGPNGEKIDGILETVEEKVDEEYLRDMWGGGEFQLTIQTQQKDGKYKYLRGRTINIGGKPKWQGQDMVAGTALVTGPGTAEEDGLASQAFKAMQDIAKDARAREDKAREGSQQNRGFDAEAFTALNQPMVEQLRAAQLLISNLQTQLIAQASKAPPKDEFRDKLLEKAIGDEGARIEHLRTVYEVRIDKLKDEHQSDLKRIEDRHEKAIERLEERHSDEVRRMESAHEREMKSIEKNGEFSTKSMDTANTARIEQLKAESARIERELNAAQTKIATLEAKKDQSLTEKAEELIKVKEAIDGIGGGSDGDEPWYQKVIDGLANSEMGVNLINKIAGGPGDGPEGGPQPGQPIAVQPGVPFRGPDGNVYVADQHGNVQLVDPAAMQQRRIAGARRRRAQAPQQPPQQGGPRMAQGSQQVPAQQQPQAIPPTPPGKMPKGKDVAIAVNFMENAVRNGTPPEKFAQTARSLVPGDILALIHRVGIDTFLDKVVQPGSVLTTLRGRQFARAVAQVLLTGEMQPAPAPAPEELDTSEPDPADVGADDPNLLEGAADDAIQGDDGGEG